MLYTVPLQVYDSQHSKKELQHAGRMYSKDDSTFAPSQWEAVLLCNGASHWLGASLESAMYSKEEPLGIAEKRKVIHTLESSWKCQNSIHYKVAAEENISGITKIKL